jgi:hypothetical protein
MKSRWIDRGVAVFLIGISLWFYTLSHEFPMGGDLFPKFTLVTIILLAALLFGQTVLGKAKPSAKAPPAREGRDTARPYLLFGLSLLYALGMYLIGYLSASLVTAVLLVPVLGVEKKVLYSCVIGGVILFIYLLFNRFLMVQLPAGLLFS